MMRGWFDEELFSAARARIERGDPTAIAARDALLQRADAALDRAPGHVRQAGGSPRYRQDGVYFPDRDGVRNPDADRRAGELANRFSNDTLHLATAFRLTRDPRYAEGALSRIHAWCIDENTRMFPTGWVEDAATPGAVYGGDVVLFLALRSAFHAMALMNGYAGWGLARRGAVRRWIRDMVEPQRRHMFFEGVEMINNWEDARLAYLGFAAAALDDPDLLLEVFERWKLILPLKMTDAGELPRETMRTRSLTYTIAALRSMAFVAELAAGYGEKLYDCTVNGRGFRLALDFATPHVRDPSTWPFPMIEPFAADGEARGAVGLFELALRQWGDPRYQAVIEACGGRPDVSTHTTLLFGGDGAPFLPENYP